MAKRENGSGSILRRKRKDGSFYRGFFVRFFKADGGRTMVFGGESRIEAEATLARLLAGDSVLPGPAETAAPASFVAPGPAAPGLRLVDFLNGGYLDRLRFRLSEGGFSMSAHQLVDAAAFFGERPMASIAKRDIEAFLRHRGRLVEVGKAKVLKPKNCPNTLKKTLYSLSVAWRAASEEGIVEGNPCLGVKTPKVQEGAVLPHGYIPPADMAKVFAAVQPEYQDLLRFLHLSGLRLGEGLNLGWSAVRHDLGAITVTKSKSGKVRVVPLPGEAQALLRRLQQERRILKVTCPDFVFPRLDRANLRKRLRWGTWKILGYHLRIHDLRHLYATGLVLAGVPVTTVARLLGHADARMVLQRYGHHMPADAAEEAIRRLEAYQAGMAAAWETRRTGTAG